MEREGHENQIGPENGLSLILRGESAVSPFYERNSKVGNTVSFRVSIHEPNTVPMIIDKGMELLPGT